MNSMFYNCSSLTSLDISKWDTKNVENITSMFEKCIKLSGTLDLSAMLVGSGGFIFKDCSNLNKVKMPKFKESASCPFGIFEGCSSLTEVDFGEGYPRFGNVDNGGDHPIFFRNNEKITKVSGNLNVDFTNNFDKKYVQTDYWINSGWKWFMGCNMITDINFTGTVYYLADGLDYYPIFGGCNTSNLSHDSWLSFVSIFPDNNSNENPKRICIGSKLTYVPEDIAMLLANKGYTLYEG